MPTCYFQQSETAKQTFLVLLSYLKSKATYITNAGIKSLKTGSFTFNYSIADCVGDGRKKEERDMKRRSEPDSCFRM